MNRRAGLAYEDFVRMKRGLKRWITGTDEDQQGLKRPSPKVPKVLM